MAATARLHSYMMLLSSLWRRRSILSSLAPLALASVGCSSGQECESYVDATIAELRTAGGSGCFELKDVVVVARTPSPTTPRLYLQERAGGDFSALMAKCSETGKHPCSREAAQSLGTVLKGAIVTVRGYYHQGSRSGFEELYIDSATDSGYLAEPPLPIALEPADVAKTARHPEAWFQNVSIVVPAGDPWLIADLSPRELALGPECPRWAGFAMTPASRGAPAAMDCVNGENPPPAVSGVDVADGQILIGRQFYDGFWASSDCACALEHKQHLISSFSTLVGPVSGVLILEQMQGVTVQMLEPLSRAAFPVSGG
jgi:hypothetical protein